MGLEIKTTALQGSIEAQGKLHLDSKQLQFSGKSFKWSVDLGPRVRAKSVGNQLIVSEGRSEIRFEIRKGVDRWVDKILHPPSRITKLGVKPDAKCWLSKGFDRAFRDELKSSGATTTRKIEHCMLAFLKVTDRKDLSQVVEHFECLPGDVNIWVVWPKGSEAIGQGDVMAIAKQRGFGPSKTAAFDEQHSSMRFAKRKPAK